MLFPSSCMDAQPRQLSIYHVICHTSRGSGIRQSHTSSPMATEDVMFKYEGIEERRRKLLEASRLEIEPKTSKFRSSMIRLYHTMLIPFFFFVDLAFALLVISYSLIFKCCRSN